MAFLFLGWARSQPGAQVLRDGAAWVASAFINVSSEKFKDRLRARRRIGLIVDDAVRDADGARATLLCVHHSSGKPFKRDFETVEKLLISVVESAVVSKISNAKRDWDSQDLHPAYAKDILAPIIKDANNVYIIRTEDLSDDNPLKPFFMKDGINLTTIRFVCDFPVAFYFTSINFKNDLNWKPGVDPLTIPQLAKAVAVTHAAAEALKPKVVALGEFKKE